VDATDGEIRAVEIPHDLRPDVAYSVAVVEGAENPQGAHEFVDGLTAGPGAEALEAAGFGPPPRT
jgi:ABC-type molybdate transport system substrate-binding protein